MYRYSMIPKGYWYSIDVIDTISHHYEWNFVPPFTHSVQPVTSDFFFLVEITLTFHRFSGIQKEIFSRDSHTVYSQWRNPEAGYIHLPYFKRILCFTPATHCLLLFANNNKTPFKKFEFTKYIYTLYIIDSSFCKYV